MNAVRPTTVLALIALAVASPLPVRAAQSAHASFEREIPLPAGGTLRLDNLLGSITVRAGNTAGAARVSVEVVAEADNDGAAQRLADAIVLTLDEAGGSLAARLVFPVDDHPAFRLPRSEKNGVLSRWVTPLLDRKGSAVEYAGRQIVVGDIKGAAAVAAHVTVTLPYDARAALRQAVGPLHGAGLRGDLDVETVDGDLLIEQVYGSLRARSAHGGVDVRQFTGDELSVDGGEGNVTLTSVRAEEARLHTTSGRIEGHGLRARKLRVDTVSGDVVFDELEPLEMELHTDSGDVDLSTELTGTRSASIRSDSGDVTLRIGRLVPFALEAETEKGSVKTRDLAVEVVEKDDGRRASIRRGRNGARLDVVTVSGKVALRSL